MLMLKELAGREGLRAEGWRLSLKELLRARLPAILFINENHFVVVDSVSESGDVFMRDPALGKLKMAGAMLLKVWSGETLIFTPDSARAAGYLNG